jgi:UDP-N-acetyl-D-glucosamine dehydrogenase
MTVPKKKDPIEQTRLKIKSGDARIGIIGLGYVGLPLALAFLEKFPVIGYDADEKKSEMLRRGKSYIDDVPDKAVKEGLGNGFRIAKNFSKLRECEVIIICVPTPLDKRGYPDLSYIAHSSDIVEKIVRKGMLVVLESTSYPGTTDEFLGRAIRRAGLTPGKGVALAFSPERVDPGNKKYSIRNTPKVVGGVDARSTEIASELYSAIVDAGVVRVRDCSTAEAVKIVENIFRGVNIALINELALIFERMDIDTWEVIKAASTKPFAFMAHYPGPGVGGHCIPLDPMYLSYKAKQYGMVPRFIELSHEVNEFMKHHTVNLTMAALKKAGLDNERATVAVMGIAYKKDISDTRESPAAEIIEELSKRVKKVLVHDPKAESITTPVGTFRTVSMKDVMAEANCLVFVTNHSEFEKLKPRDLLGKHVRAIVDTRNLFDKDKVESLGLVYKGIGK